MKEKTAMLKQLTLALLSLSCLTNTQATTANILNNIFTPDYVSNISNLPDKGKLDASIFTAVAQRDLPALQAALKNGADVTSKAGAFAFTTAAQGGYTEMVTALLAAGIPVDIPLSDIPPFLISMNGFTALMTAAVAGHHNIIDILLAAGANVNAESASGFRPLFCALANSGRTDKEAAALIEKFIKAGADINARIQLKIDPSSAADSDDEDDEEDDIERKRHASNANILDMAMRFGHQETSALLSKAGAIPLDSESPKNLQEHISREESYKNDNDDDHEIIDADGNVYYRM